MSLGDDELLRASYYCASEIIRGRRRTGQPIPEWLRRHYNQLDTQIKGMSPRGPSVAENAFGAPQSAHGDVIGTREAAAMLSIAPRQARRRADQLGGALVAGRWLFLRDSVAEYAEGRRRDG
jgi:hypothetical protein